MKTTITWLLMNSFTIITLDMDSALHAEYSDVVLCGAFAAINNYPMDGLATVNNSTNLLRNLNYKQTHQIMPIWNGFHTTVFIRGHMTYTWMPDAYIKLIPLEITDSTHDLYYDKVTINRIYCLVIC